MTTQQITLIILALILIGVGCCLTNFWVIGAGAILAAASTYRSNDDNDDVYSHSNRMAP